MPDFRMQQIQGNLPAVDALLAVSLVPSNINGAKAMLIPQSNRWVGAPALDVAFNSAVNAPLTAPDWAASVQLTDNEMNIRRQWDSGNAPTLGLLQRGHVLEYIGSVGGPNEFESLGEGVCDWHGASTATSALSENPTTGASLVFPITDPLRCAIIPSGAWYDQRFNVWNRFLGTFELVPATGGYRVRCTRGAASGGLGQTRFQVIRFPATATNWTVQRVDFTFPSNASGGVNDVPITRNITAIDPLHTFIINTYRSGSGTIVSGSDQASCICGVNSATSLYYMISRYHDAPTTANCITYVLSNATLRVYNIEVAPSNPNTFPAAMRRSNELAVTLPVSLNRIANTVSVMQAFTDVPQANTREPMPCIDWRLNVPTTGQPLTTGTLSRPYRGDGTSHPGRYYVQVINYPDTTVTKVASFDAVLAKSNTRATSVNAVLQKNFSKTASMEALLRKTVIKQSTVDAWLVKGGSKSTSLNAQLAKSQFQGLLLDFLLEARGVRLMSLNAVIQRKGSKTSNVNSHLQKRVFTSSQLDAIKVFGRSKSVTLDAFLIRNVHKEASFDAIIASLWSPIDEADSAWTKLTPPP